MPNDPPNTTAPFQDGFKIFLRVATCPFDNLFCRKHSIFEAQFYKWNKEFLEAGKKRLAGDTVREATSDEVAELRKENQKLKETVADLVLRYDIVKKSLNMLDQL